MKYMDKVVEKLSIFKMTKEERASYSYYQKQLHTDHDELQAAEARGRTKGKAKGKIEEKILIAKNLLAQNIDPTIISAVTGLPEQDIEKLKS